MHRSIDASSPEIVPATKSHTCSIDGCDGAVVGRGWCRKHYNRWFRHGDPLVCHKRGKKAPERVVICRSWQCPWPARTMGYCANCYNNRLRWHGTVR